MSETKLEIAVEAMADFLLPHLADHLKKLSVALGKRDKQDYSDADWWIILDERNKGELHKHHVLVQLWSDFEEYLHKKKALYCYIVPPTRGLVSKPGKFWLCFSPPLAEYYLKAQMDTPRTFKVQQMFKLPPLDLFLPIQASMEQVDKAPDLPVVEKLQRFSDLLQIADAFLPEAQVQQIDPLMADLCVKLVQIDVEKLMGDVKNPGVSKVKLESRLKVIHNLAWRYYKADNELESTYMQKLTSEDTEERIKGLRLTVKKTTDYIHALKAKQA